MNLIHAWGRHHTYCLNTGHHNYRGSLKRHIIVENLFNWLAKSTTYIHKMTGSFFLYKTLRIPFTIVWGLNCGFPITDVMHYTAFWIRHATFTLPRE